MIIIENIPGALAKTNLREQYFSYFWILRLLSFFQQAPEHWVIPVAEPEIEKRLANKS